MSENPAPYNPHSNQTPALLRVASFMNGYLGFEMLYDIPCPEKFYKREYDDLNQDEKREWYEYTLNELFHMAARDSFSVLGREPNVVELGLIKRRIVNYFKQAGIEYDK